MTRMTSQETTASPGPTPLLRVLLWSTVYLLPLGVALLPILDYDIWWHLRLGQSIVEHGAIPATDSFSQYGLQSGKPWIAYSWLFEVLAYGAYRAFGYEGIFLGRALMTLAIVLTLHRLVAKREPRFIVAAGFLGVAVLALL